MKGIGSRIFRLISFFLFIFVFTNQLQAQQSNSHYVFDMGRYRSLFNDGNELLQPKEVFDHLSRYDVNFYKLDLNVSNTSIYIAGSTTIGFTVIQPIDTLYLELMDSLQYRECIIVDSVLVNGSRCRFVHDKFLLRIFGVPLQAGNKASSTVFYRGRANPAIIVSKYSGLSYLTSGSEPLNAKRWFPCKQVLDDKADSTEVIITTESTNKAGSNGLLVSTTNLPGNKVRYRWKSNYPVAYYLISIAVGPYIEYNTYVHIAGLKDSVLIQNYLINDEELLPKHYTAIRKIKQCLDLFSRLYGAYPFRKEKYGHCVDGWPLGAMENQTMTTIGYKAFDTTAVSYYDYYNWYSVHELAHSWFGDYITCSTWDDYWLNEGFASYLGEYVALQNIESQASADKWIRDAIKTAVALPGGSIYGHIIDSYALSYKKSSLILHMLRFELNNDSLFFNIFRSYLSKFGNKTASTLDFKSVVEESTGKDFSYFFDQWVFGEGYPIFSIEYYQSNDTLYITSKQTASISRASLFKMPFNLRLNFPDSAATIRLYQEKAIEKFIIVLNKTVTSVTFDPEFWLLAKSLVKLTGIEETPMQIIKQFRLEQNYPNPFNSETVINYSVSKLSFVTLKVYDMLGREIKVLVNENKPAGDYSLRFNSENLANGIYFYRLQSGSYETSQKLVILK